MLLSIFPSNNLMTNNIFSWFFSCIDCGHVKQVLGVLHTIADNFCIALKQLMPLK